MALELYDTLTRAKRALPSPDDQGTVRLYTCGPTVYNRVHIGNLRAFLTYDLLRRSLEWLGYDVRHVMNITDVDDKTIRDSQKEGVSLREFTDRYTALFLADLDALAIERPHVMPRATEAVEAMVALVEQLLVKGHAYRSEDGSVYFKIDSFPAYGRLSHLEQRELRAGAGGRVTSDEYDKDNVQDFALWKAWTPADGDVFWETSLGKGRPGWHLECSALAMEHLGSTVDIHAGGVDLVFPHHENEIAQSEAATGEPFVKLWVHNEHLLVGGKKMSKSLGNFYTLQDLQDLARATPREVRYALLSGHYRSQLNFNVTYEDQRPVRFDSLEQSRQALRTLDGFREQVRAAQAAGGEPGPAQRARVEQARADYRAAIEDDLNVSKALAVVFTLRNEVKDGQLELAGAGALLEDFLSDADRVLGFLEPEAEPGLSSEEQALFERWVAAREAKDWASADALREQLKQRGIGVQARKGESTWQRI